MKRIALPLSLVAALAACESGPKVVSPPPPGSATVHEDLPAPQGFEFTENQSNVGPAGGVRAVTQVLRGRERRVEPAVQFYLDVFPKHGWTLEGKEGDPKAGPAKLTFGNKKNERCTVDVKDESRTAVRVTVKVGPKS
jgi:hypothetical protein